MRVSRFCLALALLLHASQGCRTLAVPPGTYSGASGADKIVVLDREILVHIENSSDSSIRHSEERCHYRLASDHRIVLSLPSTHYQTGVGRFDYFWTGEAISVGDPNTGKVMLLRRKD